MKFTTFIKSYKIAISQINEKVSDWEKVYIGEIIFPNASSYVIHFIFSSGYNMQPGDLAISVPVNSFNVEKLDGGLNGVLQLTNGQYDAYTLAREYIDAREKINDVGRMLVLLDLLLKQCDAENTCIDCVSFNFDKDIAEFKFDDKTIYTNGMLTTLE